MPPRLVVVATGRVVATDVVTATRTWEKARGLLGTDSLPGGRALVISKARQVHTVGMRYPIDVCFCDRAWKVLHVVRAMQPGRLTRWVRGGSYVVEASAGTFDGIEPGDQLSLEDPSDR